MLLRIVHMRFTEEGVEKFLAIFVKHQDAIRHVAGCSHLELLKHPDDPQRFSTLSYWEGEEYLEAYRHSTLFESVWGSVKPLFSERSKAFSLEKFIEV